MSNPHVSSNPIEITFYYKEDCHLCDDMAEKLQEFISALNQKYTITVTRRDIEDDSNWYARYREYVPVLVVHEREVCHYFFDHEELMEAISAN